MDLKREELALFQHTAARRRLMPSQESFVDDLVVSTHSRPKAADRYPHQPAHWVAVSTHSRPKAADGRENLAAAVACVVSTHSRPKAADQFANFSFKRNDCFNTQPPEGG